MHGCKINIIAIPFDINTYACRISCPPNGWNDSILSGNAIPTKPLEIYYERKIGGTIYRVTNIHDGNVDLTKAIEDFIVRKILQKEAEH